MVLTTTDLPLVIPQWDAPSTICAYTTTCVGGVSINDYCSLNVGLHVGDIAVNVEQNRAKLPGAEKVSWLQQVHGAKVATLPDEDRTADASISRSASHWCAVMTADCIPVLLCNKQGNVVAAIHAGWQGLDKQIIKKTVASMGTPPSSLLAWIGPAICAAHYQVDTALADKFSHIEGAVSKDSQPDKWRLDLTLIAQFQLQKAGVVDITTSAQCTYSQHDKFFSHRRATHNGRPATGRIVSVIGIT